jgi:hypothetical protein
LRALKKTKYFIHRVIQCISEGFFQEYAYQENADYIVLVTREAILAACISAKVSWLASSKICFKHIEKILCNRNKVILHLKLKAKHCDFSLSCSTHFPPKLQGKECLAIQWSDRPAVWNNFKCCAIAVTSRANHIHFKIPLFLHPHETLVCIFKCHYLCY